MKNKINKTADPKDKGISHCNKQMAALQKENLKLQHKILAFKRQIIKLELQNSKLKLRNIALETEVKELKNRKDMTISDLISQIGKRNGLSAK
jgi:cell division protein FtsB